MKGGCVGAVLVVFMSRRPRVAHGQMYGGDSADLLIVVRAIVMFAFACSSGRLKGDIGNLTTVLGVVAPLFWARVYAACVDAPGGLYLVIAAIQALQLAQSAYLRQVCPGFYASLVRSASNSNK